MQLFASLVGDQAFLAGLINSVAIPSSLTPQLVLPISRAQKVPPVRIRVQQQQEEEVAQPTEEEQQAEEVEKKPKKSKGRRKEKHKKSRKKANGQEELSHNPDDLREEEEERRARKAQREGSEETSKSNNEELVNVFVKNLPAEATPDLLLACYGRFGACNPYLSMDNDRCRGFGFMSMPASNFEEAQKLRLMCEGQYLWIGIAQKKKDREIELRTAFESARAKRAEMTKGLNLIVSNLPFDMDSQKFHELFAPLGSATSIYLALNEQGRSRGFGFAAYATREDAQRVIELMNNKVYNDRRLRVAVHNPKQ